MNQRPNIVYILADDMGYGDVRCLNPDCKFPTPNLDRLGGEGMAFIDAHSSSSVCTPSRYSILTGRYCWRTYLKQGVLCGTSGPLIEKGRQTVGSMLQNAGYRTACIGKWHLGWNWAVKPGKKAKKNQWNGEMDWIDFEQPITEGPTTRGFDHFYGFSGSLDMPPYVYVEDDRPVETPTAWGTADEFLRPGPRMESLRAHNVLGHITDKAVDYISSQDGDTPFFLYFPLNAPHTPIAPAEEFVGKSGINDYADFCMEVDHRVGQVLDVLDEKGMADNTLVIFTTDNGASAAPSQCEMLEKEFGHYCSHVYRGYKSDIWDGGHRLPFLVRWPETVTPGARCGQYTGLFDFYATVGEITGQMIPEFSGEDSLSFLPALRGESIDTKSRTLVHHSISGMFAIRKGRWKLCRCPGSGGWSSPTDKQAAEKQMPEIQLYDMENAPDEQTNVAGKHPDIVRELTQELHRSVVSGKSVKGRKGEEIAVEDWPQINWLPDIPDRFVADD